MIFLRFGFEDFPADELSKFIRRTRGVAPRMIFPQKATEDYYAIFISSKDADVFRQLLNERGVAYTEPGDLPSHIKKSREFSFFLRATDGI